MHLRLLDIARRGDDARFRSARGVALGAALLLMAPRLAGALLMGAADWDCISLLASITLVAASLTAARYGYGRIANVLVVVAVFELGYVCMGYWSVMCFHVGRNFPLIDAPLALLDKKLGFAWTDYLIFIDSHSWINAILYPAYMSIFWQPLAIAIALVFAARDRDAMKLFLAFTVGLTTTLAVSVFAPAYGAYHYFGVVPSMHAHIGDLVTGDGTAAALDWLRLASPQGFLPENHGGLVTFLSFHTTAALLFVWYCRRLKGLLVASVLLNGAMLLATPLHGSHYLGDMLGGAIVAAFAVATIELAFEARFKVPLGVQGWRLKLAPSTSGASPEHGASPAATASGRHLVDAPQVA